MISKLHNPVFLKAWAVILLLPFVYLAGNSINFNNSILSLLPATEQDPLIEKGVKYFSEKISSRSLYLIGHENFTQAAEATEKFTAVLAENEIFEETIYKAEENTGKNWYEMIFPHRYHILTKESRELLNEGSEEFLKDRVKKLYSPVSPLYTPHLEKDPLMFFGDYMKQIPAPGNVGIKDGYLAIEHEKKWYIMISTRFKAQVFDREAQNSIRVTLDKAVKEANGAEFLQSSFFPYAEHGRKQAEWEISVIGGGSTIGIALLFFLVFKSATQLAMTIFSIATGVVWGIVSTQLIFGEIHLFTLIFGASLIGVCVDYSFHFFAKRLYKRNEWEGFQGLRAILPGISLGALTSILAYAALLTADFPGLQQVACFACIGLLISFLCVIIYFPVCFKNPGKKTFKPFAWVQAYSKLWATADKKKFCAVTVLVLLISFAGFAVSKTNDDVRLLQGRPKHLVDQERKVYEIIRSVDNSRFLMVKAPTTEDLLIREEEICLKLEKLISQKSLTSYFCISRLLPSEKKQIADLQLLKSKINLSGLQKYGEELGFEPEVLEKCLQDINSSSPLTLEKFLDSPASKSARSLYMGKIDGSHLSIILLEGIKNKSDFNSFEGASYIDKVGSISATFTKYRIKATWITIIAYFLILLILSVKFGVMKAMKILLPPVLAALLSCAAISFLGIPLNLFNILSLLIVLGIGIDYSIFFAISSKDHEATGLAILLSSASTVLAFGLLSLSYTASVKTFGLTLLFGIIFSVFLAPMAKDKENPA